MRAAAAATAAGLRPLLVAGPPLDEQLLVLLALLPMPHQAWFCSFTGVSVQPLRAAAWDGRGSIGWWRGDQVAAGGRRRG